MDRRRFPDSAAPTSPVTIDISGRGRRTGACVPDFFSVVGSAVASGAVFPAAALRAFLAGALSAGAFRAGFSVSAVSAGPFSPRSLSAGAFSAAAFLAGAFLAGAFSARAARAGFSTGASSVAVAASDVVAPPPARLANHVSSTSRVTPDWALLTSTPMPAMAARNSLLVIPTALAAACARIFSGSALRSSMVRFESDTCLLWPDSGRDHVTGVLR
ncbi:hypothetical protein [Dietzia cercidiphylli]|uniref:hypothetical protein n=1 Tax=Dietzia cercidiphylli TaxID=498199 RepID=UPI004056C97B